MMVKLDDDGMLLVHREAQVLADEFFCTTISGASQVYNLQVQRTGGPGRQSVYTIETSAPNIHKVVEKSCNPKEGLLIPVANVNHLTDYDVKIRVLSPPPVHISYGPEAPTSPFVGFTMGPYCNNPFAKGSVGSDFISPFSGGFKR